MHGLPKLPGLDFEGKFKQRHHVPQAFGFKNGYRIPSTPACGIGGDPLKEESLAFNKSGKDPIL